MNRPGGNMMHMLSVTQTAAAAAEATICPFINATTQLQDQNPKNPNDAVLHPAVHSSSGRRGIFGGLQQWCDAAQPG